MKTNDKINLRTALKLALPHRAFVRKSDMLFMVGILYGYTPAQKVVDLYHKNKVKAFRLQ